MGTAHDEWIRREMVEEDPRFVRITLKSPGKQLTFFGRHISKVEDDFIFQDEYGNYISRINDVIEEWDTADELIDTLLFLIHKEN